MKTAEDLTPIWDKLVDHVCVLWLISNVEKRNHLESEFERVGLLQTGKVEFMKIQEMSLIKKRLLTTLATEETTTKKGFYKGVYGTDTAYRHYCAMYNSLVKGYEKVLIFEDDMCFLKSLDELYGILTNIPEDCELCLFDHLFIQYDSIVYTPEKFREISEKANDYYYKLNFCQGNWTAGCYYIKKNVLEYFTEYLTTEHFCAVDNLLSCELAPKFKTYFSHPCIALQDDKELHIWRYRRQGNNSDNYNFLHGEH